jgi:hypothetical protein
VDVLLICGAAGVGKSTVSWEIGLQLQAAKVPHAIIDTDELDRVFPQPEPLPALIALSRRNLEALWRSFAELGHVRLILCGVMLDLDSSLAWICESLDDPDVTVVRLLASDDTLKGRIELREIGSGRESQLSRTLQHAEHLRTESTSRAIIFDTDGRCPEEIAKSILTATRFGA